MLQLTQFSLLQCINSPINLRVPKYDATFAYAFGDGQKAVVYALTVFCYYYVSSAYWPSPKARINLQLFNNYHHACDLQYNVLHSKNPLQFGGQGPDLLQADSQPGNNPYLHQAMGAP